MIFIFLLYILKKNRPLTLLFVFTEKTFTMMNFLKIFLNKENYINNLFIFNIFASMMFSNFFFLIKTIKLIYRLKEYLIFYLY